MANLIHHIEYLLLRHNQVIVPGFGIFYLKRRPAFITENKTLIPPTSEIVYNQSVIDDDGLLTESFARKYKLTLSEARKWIEEEVYNLKRGLGIDNKLSLGNLGSISTKKNNKISFSYIPGLAVWVS